MSLVLTSPAFSHGERIPDSYCADSPPLSPSLIWAGEPEGIDSYVLICHDPDAPLPDGWLHWVLADIPPGVDHLDEGETKYRPGLNSWDEPGYRGPAPPAGHGVHFYYFHLYAVDATLEKVDGPDWPAWQANLRRSTIAQARLVGTFSR